RGALLGARRARQPDFPSGRPRVRRLFPPGPRQGGHEPPLRAARLRLDATRHRDARDVCRPRRPPSLRALLDVDRTLQLPAPARPPERDRAAGDAELGMTALLVAGWSNFVRGRMFALQAALIRRRARAAAGRR